MELNIDSPIICELNTRLLNDKNDKTIKDIVWLLYDTTLLNSGFSLDESNTFCNRIHRMINLGLGLDIEENGDNDNNELVDDDEVKVDTDVDKVDLEEESKMEDLD
jgi:molecular chaperone HtpG